MPETRFLAIGEVARRTGVAEQTLRMWERRHGFPVPARTPGGRRRYPPESVGLVRAVQELREQGVSVGAAITRVQDAPRAARTVTAALRASHPTTAPQRMRKPELLALCRAVEDELFARAPEAAVFGCFQHERFYRGSESRWRALCRTFDFCAVFGEFEADRDERGGPWRVGLGPGSPLLAEWAVVCDGPSYAVAIAGVELPEEDGGERRFDVLWSVDPAAVRRGAQALVALLSEEAAPALPAWIGEPPSRPAELDDVMALANRMVAYVQRATR